MPRQITFLLPLSKDVELPAQSGPVARNTRNISLLGSSYLRYKKSTVFRSWLNHLIILNATTIPSIETQIRKYQSCQFHYYALIKPRCFPYHTETVAQYLRLKAFNSVRLLSSSLAQKNPTGRRVEVRRSAIHRSSRLGVWAQSKQPCPVKHPRYGNGNEENHHYWARRAFRVIENWMFIFLSMKFNP